MRALYSRGGPAAGRRADKSQAAVSLTPQCVALKLGTLPSAAPSTDATDGAARFKMAAKYLRESDKRRGTSKCVPDVTIVK